MNLSNRVLGSADPDPRAPHGVGLLGQVRLAIYQPLQGKAKGKILCWVR